jgi:UDP-N-acetylglucosamine 4,6-dehydratase
MITKEDARNTIDIGGYYVIKPEVCRYKGVDGARVSEEFEYNSGTNTERLSMETMRAMLHEQGFALARE